MTRPVFRDRLDAGEQLARELAGYDLAKPVVLGLPRGGVPIAHTVAHELDLAWDVLVVRKLGYPGHPELAIGAIGEGDVHVLNEALLAQYPVPGGALSTIERRERAELERRVGTYRPNRPLIDVGGEPVIIVDDGIATGSTMLAAIEVVRCMGSTDVTVAVPVAPPAAVEMISHRADRVVALATPRDFGAVGFHYRDFTQVDDRTVTALLGGNPAPSSRA